ncbi:hypothetical protein DIPPA_21327 [Diplonema papillatum]|nr:hypothetical protein DIPPA_21327 [Diplonema papillatum]
MPRYRHGGTQTPLSAAAQCPSEEAASDEDEDGREAADEGEILRALKTAAGLPVPWAMPCPAPPFLTDPAPCGPVPVASAVLHRTATPARFAFAPSLLLQHAGRAASSEANQVTTLLPAPFTARHPASALHGYHRPNTLWYKQSKLQRYGKETTVMVLVTLAATLCSVYKAAVRRRSTLFEKYDQRIPPTARHSSFLTHLHDLGSEAPAATRNARLSPRAPAGFAPSFLHSSFCSPADGQHLAALSKMAHARQVAPSQFHAGRVAAAADEDQQSATRAGERGRPSGKNGGAVGLLVGGSPSGAAAAAAAAGSAASGSSGRNASWAVCVEETDADAAKRRSPPGGDGDLSAAADGGNAASAVSSNRTASWAVCVGETDADAAKRRSGDPSAARGGNPAPAVASSRNASWAACVGETDADGAKRRSLLGDDQSAANAGGSAAPAVSFSRNASWAACVGETDADGAKRRSLIGGDPPGAADAGGNAAWAVSSNRKASWAVCVGAVETDGYAGGTVPEDEAAAVLREELQEHRGAIAALVRELAICSGESAEPILEATHPATGHPSDPGNLKRYHPTQPPLDAEPHSIDPENLAASAPAVADIKRAPDAPLSVSVEASDPGNLKRYHQSKALLGAMPDTMNPASLARASAPAPAAAGAKRSPHASLPASVAAFDPIDPADLAATAAAFANVQRYYQAQCALEDRVRDETALLEAICDAAADLQPDTAPTAASPAQPGYSDSARSASSQHPRAPAPGVGAGWKPAVSFCGAGDDIYDGGCPQGSRAAPQRLEGGRSAEASPAPRLPEHNDHDLKVALSSPAESSVMHDNNSQDGCSEVLKVALSPVVSMHDNYNQDGCSEVLKGVLPSGGKVSKDGCPEVLSVVVSSPVDSAAMAAREHSNLGDGSTEALKVVWSPPDSAGRPVGKHDAFDGLNGALPSPGYKTLQADQLSTVGKHGVSDGLNGALPSPGYKTLQVDQLSPVGKHGVFDGFNDALPSPGSKKIPGDQLPTVGKHGALPPPGSETPQADHLPVGPRHSGDHSRRRAGSMLGGSAQKQPGRRSFSASRSALCAGGRDLLSGGLRRRGGGGASIVVLAGGAEGPGSGEIGGRVERLGYAAVLEEQRQDLVSLCEANAEYDEFLADCLRAQGLAFCEDDDVDGQVFPISGSEESVHPQPLRLPPAHRPDPTLAPTPALEESVAVPPARGGGPRCSVSHHAGVQPPPLRCQAGRVTEPFRRRPPGDFDVPDLQARLHPGTGKPEPNAYVKARRGLLRALRLARERETELVEELMGIIGHRPVAPRCGEASVDPHAARAAAGSPWIQLSGLPKKVVSSAASARRWLGSVLPPGLRASDVRVCSADGRALLFFETLAEHGRAGRILLSRRDLPMATDSVFVCQRCRASVAALACTACSSWLCRFCHRFVHEAKDLPHASVTTARDGRSSGPWPTEPVVEAAPCTLPPRLSSA